MSHVPTGWVASKIQDLGEIVQGQSPPGESYNDAGKGLPFFQGKAEFGSLYPSVRKWCTQPAKLAKAGDILLSIRAPVGATNLCQADACIGRGLAAIRPLCGVLPRYVMYGLRATVAALAAKGTGSTFQAVSGQQVREHRIPLAPVAEQRRIVATIEEQFTRLDAAVASLKRARTNLKRYRAAVLCAAFEGRLVPTEAERARVEGRTFEPGDVLVARIMNGRSGQQAFTAPTPLRSVGLPEGWTLATIGQLFHVGVGATPSRRVPEYWGGNVPWVSSGEVAFCRIWSTRECITADALRNSSTELHPPGTVLIGMIGEGKTRGQVAILEVAACNNQNSAAIRVSEAGVPPEYVYRYLQSQYEHSRRLGSGNNQPALNKSRVQAMALPLPPLVEQQRIVAEVERRLSVVEETEATIEANLKRAERLRQSILKRAFEGKLVPQDLTDEPASILLERIRAERTRSATNGARRGRRNGRQARTLTQPHVQVALAH